MILWWKDDTAAAAAELNGNRPSGAGERWEILNWAEPREILHTTASLSPWQPTALNLLDGNYIKKLFMWAGSKFSTDFHLHKPFIAFYW